jgi:quercetin dioxygenase-like cupin family protein
VSDAKYTDGPSQQPYSPSPRPTFDVPTRIGRDAVTRHLWGDEEAGVVSDLIYASTSLIHALVFGLPPGGSFTHSPEYRTVFAADELLHVLDGTMVLANPETGEVQKVTTGRSVFFRKDTWHHAFAHGGAPLRVLEIFAPPPAAGTSGAYARTRPYLEQSWYADDSRLGDLPSSAAPAPIPRLLGESDVVWRRDLGVLVGLLVSTEHLTVHSVEVNAGETARAHAHGGDELLFVIRGVLWVRAWHRDQTYVFELGPEDACLIPQGAPHEYRNFGAETATALVGVAPSYLP